MSATSVHDVLVLGAGPAALSLAVAAAERGLRPAVIAPRPDAPWAPNYGVFADEVPDVPRAFVWDRTRIVAESSHDLQRGYANVDKDAFRAGLLARLHAAGGRTIAATAGDVVHEGAEARVSLDGGETVRGRWVVDATGTNTPRIERHPDPGPPHCQWACGIEVACAEDPFDPGEMRMMDFTPAPDELSLPPTFLYAMPRGQGRWFLEETVLTAPGRVDFALLERRLRGRLAHAGIVATDTGEPQEHCRILMNVPLPVLGQPTLAFGAAAGYVHPGTGYSLAFTLRHAPGVADALAAHIDEPVDVRYRAVWDAIWPPADRSTHRFYRRGGSLLAGLDGRQVRAFFESFFRLKPEQRSAFLDRTATLPALYKIGLAQYARMSWMMKTAFAVRYPGTRSAAGAPF